VTPVDNYVARASAAIMEVLAEHHAVVHPELEARIAEASFVGGPDNVDPHHITNALRSLTSDGHIGWVQGTTRGGRTVQTIQLTDTRRRTTRVQATASRKRLLYARYTGWSQGTKRHPQGLVGPAGERAVRTAILEASSLQPAAPGAGEVSSLLGFHLPGPLDSAGYVVTFGTDGLPQLRVPSSGAGWAGRMMRKGGAWGRL